MLLLYGCGLRTSELCALDVAHVNRERQELIILKAKGDRPHAIPIPAALYTELLAYLLEHGKRGRLFRTSIRRCRLRAKDVCQIVTDTAARAGLRAGVTPRTLRDSFTCRYRLPAVVIFSTRWLLTADFATASHLVAQTTGLIS